MRRLSWPWKPLVYKGDNVARAGVFVSLDREGGLSVSRGFVRVEDEASVIADGDCAVSDLAGQGEDVAVSTSQHGSARTVITSGG